MNKMSKRIVFNGEYDGLVNELIKDLSNDLVSYDQNSKLIESTKLLTEEEKLRLLKTLPEFSSLSPAGSSNETTWGFRIQFNSIPGNFKTVGRDKFNALPNVSKLYYLLNKLNLIKFNIYKPKFLINIFASNSMNRALQNIQLSVQHQEERAYDPITRSTEIHTPINVTVNNFNTDGVLGQDIISDYIIRRDYVGLIERTLDIYNNINVEEVSEYNLKNSKIDLTENKGTLSMTDTEVSENLFMLLELAILKKTGSYFEPNRYFRFRRRDGKVMMPINLRSNIKLRIEFSDSAYEAHKEEFDRVMIEEEEQ